MAARTEKSEKSIPWVLILNIIAIIFLMIYPLTTIKNSEFNGTDAVASEAVTKLAPDFETGWITNWWTPPSSEVESLLFALQAAAGGILIGYFFGFMRGRRKGREENESESQNPN